MDEHRRRIHDDLRGLVEGELLFEPIQRVPYARDASIYEIDPLGVIAPRGVEDLVAVTQYAAQHGIPLHARGAGTGLAGESLGPGLVLDFSRSLRRIVEIQPESVVVQAGAVLDQVNRRLAPLGRRVGPDPAGSASLTIGGMIAGNASGARSLRYGVTADHVESLSVVLADGRCDVMGLEPRESAEPRDQDSKSSLVRRVANLYSHYSDLIERQRPLSPRNRFGYTLTNVATEEGVNLARLITGSEGTLALIAEARLRTVAIPAAQSVVLLPFARLVEAASAVRDCLDAGPSACEMLDWRSLTLAREAMAESVVALPETAEAALIVEFLGDDPQELLARCRGLAHRLSRRGALVASPIEASRPADCERLLRLRDVVRPVLMRQRGSQRAIPLIEDVAVAIDALPSFLASLQAILKAHGVQWILYAHAGDGQVHVRPFLDLADEHDRAKLEPLAQDVYEAVWERGGTISGEHGGGLVRTQFLRQQYGDLVHFFQGVKETFDPQNLLNPGKIIGDDPHLMTRNLLRLPEPSANRSSELGGILEPALRWDDLPPLAESCRCNGCGVCRTQEPTLRMCPTFRALRSEEAAPRAKANLLRQVATGLIDISEWGTEQAKAIADLCVHCDLCRIECPAGVDVSSLMMEAKAAYVERHGMAPTDWLLSRIDVWSTVASRFPDLFNALATGGNARWMLERLTGLSRHRRLPHAQGVSFLRRADRLGLTRPKPHLSGPRVAYFVDLFANHFDQELAEAVVAVLAHAGVNVYVPKGQTGSGMPALAAGDVERARELATRNLRVLGNAVRDGYLIVCSEPTAALVLRREYLKLTDDLDAGVVAANTMDLGQYLAGLKSRGQLPRPELPIRMRVGYHQPCHLRALGVGTPGLDLIRTIPGIDAEFIDRGCSGMAGTYGLNRRNFRDSLRAGRPLLGRLGDPEFGLGVTECGACRMQMEQGTLKRTLHPIKLLALSYGLNPAMKRHLVEPKPRRTLSS